MQPGLLRHSVTMCILAQEFRGGHDMSAKGNKALLQRIFEELNKGNVDMVTSFLLKISSTGNYFKTRL
jgi:hypothetical protein